MTRRDLRTGTNRRRGKRNIVEIGGGKKTRPRLKRVSTIESKPQRGAGTVRTSKRNPRAFARRMRQDKIAVDLRPRPKKKPKAEPTKLPPSTKRTRKLDMIEAARAFGFKGRSYRKAVQFGRRLERARGKR